MPIINMDNTNINTASKNELTTYEWYIFRLLDNQINNCKHE